MATKRSQADRLISRCKSWVDFTTALSSLTAKEKGDAFERLTQLYLFTKPEYQTALKNAWLLAELPKRVRQKLKGLPELDEGIDLVAETRSGEFWAIQCKYKTDTAKALTVKELSTFTNLAFNTCAGAFTQSVVVHSSSKPVRKRELLGKTTEIGLQRWLEVSSEQWRLIHAKLRRKPSRPKRRSPRPHQRKAINAAKTHFLKKKESRGKLLMPCGTGKSLTAFWIAQALDAKTTLVVVPSLSLVKQSVEDWTQEFVAQNISPLPQWLCVCSDESVGKLAKDEFVADVYDLGLPVTTDPEEIKRFLRRKTDAKRIVFVTYQSSPVFAKAARKANKSIDLAIFDEAHKTAGERSKSFSTLLFDKNARIKKRMFMTATERVMRGSHDDIASMDKTEIYGDCIFHLSFKEAIHSKPAIISDYKILTVVVTEKEIEDVISERSFVTDQKAGIEAEDARYIAAGIALRKSYKKYRIKHAVSFHRSIRAASDFSDLQDRFNNVKSLRPKVDCFHISGKKTAGQRTQLLKGFAESARSLVTNARCLTEGVDIPAIDCVLFADPKQSTIDIVQAAGRALRPFEGKNFGYIMLPIIVPDGKSFEEFADSTEFRAVSKVITALSTQDERIAEEFRIRTKAKQSSGSIIQFDGSVPIGINVDLGEFANSVSAKIWERVAKANWRPFVDARAFVHGQKLRSQSDWFEFARSDMFPKDIPSNPNLTYQDLGWAGLGDWLGTGNIATKLRKYRPFKLARRYARSLNLHSGTEWRKFTKSGELPSDIPAYPSETYGEQGWAGMGDWLGTGNIAVRFREFRPFKQARRYARSLNLHSTTEWLEFSKSGKLPDDIPACLKKTYKDQGWKGMGDWLGTGRVANQLKKHRSFTKARQFARSLNLHSNTEWLEFSKSGKLPDDIPAYPNKTYKDQGWKGMGDWLGTGRVANQLKKHRSFTKARQFARSLNLHSNTEWLEFAKSGKLPDDIPAYPNKTYKDQGWSGVRDWLGTESKEPKRKK